MKHRNAPLTPNGRRRLVALVEEENLTFEAAAAASNVAKSTAHTWVTRWREAGEEQRQDLSCLTDRPSRPKSSPAQVPDAEARKICERRERTGWSPRRLADEPDIGRPASSREEEDEFVGLRDPQALRPDHDPEEQLEDDHRRRQSGWQDRHRHGGGHTRQPLGRLAPDPRGKDARADHRRRRAVDVRRRHQHGGSQGSGRGQQLAALPLFRRQKRLDGLDALRAWRDQAVAIEKHRQGRGGCPIGEIAKSDETARQEITTGFARWESATGERICAMHADPDPPRHPRPGGRPRREDRAPRRARPSGIRLIVANSVSLPQLLPETTR
jgi:transposase